jgi:ABC-2 type transport system ATP-binding protein
MSKPSAPDDPKDALSLAGVRQTFGTTVALDDVSLSVGHGEMFGVIGPDGAGKTTMLRLVCGLLRPASGTVRIFGADPFRAHRTAATTIGYLPQRFSLYGDLSIDENIEFFAQLHGVSHFADRRTRLLDLTGLTPFRDRLAERLSGGMKQKLALACTLVHEPPLLVLDEPTTGVDPVSRREFWKLLAEFLAQGLTILLATPYLDEAERCRRVALLHEGRLLALDEPSRLQRAVPGTLLEVVADAPRQALDVVGGMLGADRVQLFGDRLHVHVGVGDDMDAAAMRQRIEDAGVTVIAIRPIVPSLEDVFINLVAATRPASGSDSASERAVTRDGS